MEQNKRAYEKPSLRKVRLEVKTSVLATCHNSQTNTPNNQPLGGQSCQFSGCMSPK